MIANAGPMLSTSFNVPKLIFPSLKAIIVKAYAKKTQNMSTMSVIQSNSVLHICRNQKYEPGTSKLERSRDDENFDTNEETFDAQQKCSFLSANSRK